ncbi:MAG: LysM peptidoglycan-binding domain-containing protein [Chloroflexi bacterium]|nr:LysM peptidoglycan-binding domain-containing protein [Chloroflexota bacterium]
MRYLTEKYLLRLKCVLSKETMLCIVGFFASMLYACSRPDPIPEITTPMPTATANQTPAVDPAVGTAIAAIPPPTPSSDATPTPDGTITPPPCDRPEGWIVYEIQSFDTLYSLAAQTGSTVDELKSVNCMLDHVIIVGKTLFLPTLPPAPFIAPGGGNGGDTPPDEENGEPACSLNCTEEALPTFRSPIGGPGGEYIPCDRDETDPSVTPMPWISFETEGRLVGGAPDPNRYDREIGERGYYFVCDFPDPNRIDTAQMTWPGGSEELVLETAVDDPRLSMGEANRVVTWNAICDPQKPLPTNETYTLTVNDDQGNEATLSFTLKPASGPAILVVPQSASPGDAFQVYYCGYIGLENPEVRIDSYYEKEFVEDGRFYWLGHNRSWMATMDHDGQAMSEIKTLPDDPPRLYLLTDSEFRTSHKFWLVP